MKLGKLQLDEVDYASQGNAVLGIRDSGKTYTATYLAERLLDKDIPFIAFDPIGVWRYLRVGRDGKRGYPVVVAGDDGDLPLTAENAPNIVRAAMQENIPLVLDLYSASMTKAQWKLIVERSVNLLFFENKKYGLRHVFIEEAAEFVPQRVRPDEGKVYSVIERLARMGRNSSLGYTLINQRGEEVNKAVLELCDCLFLHRQKGRNSLTALSKWLDIADATGGREIIKSLATLPQGQCWIWPQGSGDPVLVTIPEKNTVHPDPKNPEKVASRGVSVDVGSFVERLNASLKKHASETITIKPGGKRGGTELGSADRIDNTEIGTPMDERDAMIVRLQQRLEETERQKRDAQVRNAELQNRLASVRTLLEPDYRTLRSIFEEVGNGNGASAAVESDYAIWLDKLHGKQRDMLQILIERRRVTKIQLGHLVDMAPRGGSFNTYLSKLRSLKLVRDDGEYIVLNEPE